MLSEYLIGSTIYQDGPPSEVSAFVQRHVGVHRFTTEVRSNRAMLRHTLFGNLGLSVISYGGRTTLESPVGIDCFHFQLVMSGECVIRVGSQEMLLTPGWATLINPSAPSSVTYSADCTKLIVNIPKSLVTACSMDRSPGQVPANGVCFEPLPLRAGAIAQRHSARSNCCFSKRTKKSQHAFITRPALETLFITKLLDKFPNNAAGSTPARHTSRSFLRQRGPFYRRPY